jgi:cytochrome c2
MDDPNHPDHPSWASIGEKMAQHCAMCAQIGERNPERLVARLEEFSERMLATLLAQAITDAQHDRVMRAFQTERERLRALFAQGVVPPELYTDPSQLRGSQ